jgi:hypothetical protein
MSVLLWGEIILFVATIIHSGEGVKCGVQRAHVPDVASVEPDALRHAAIDDQLIKLRRADADICSGILSTKSSARDDPQRGHARL